MSKKCKHIVQVDFKKRKYTRCGLCSGESILVPEASFDDDINTKEGRDNIQDKLIDFSLAKTVDHEKWKLTLENGGYGFKAQHEIYDPTEGDDDGHEMHHIKFLYPQKAEKKKGINPMLVSAIVCAVLFGIYIYIYLF